VHPLDGQTAESHGQFCTAFLARRTLRLPIAAAQVSQAQLNLLCQGQNAHTMRANRNTVSRTGYLHNLNEMLKSPLARGTSRLGFARKLRTRLVDGVWHKLVSKVQSLASPMSDHIHSIQSWPDGTVHAVGEHVSGREIHYVFPYCTNKSPANVPSISGHQTAMERRRVS